MCKIVFFTSIVVFSSCASHQYVYFFESIESAGKYDGPTKGIHEMGDISSNDLSASLQLEVTDTKKMVAADTGIVTQYDSVSKQNRDLKSLITYQKEVKKKLRRERNEEYRQARNTYPATKNKKLDVFAVAGAILVTAATVLFQYPLVFACLGFWESLQV